MTTDVSDLVCTYDSPRHRVVIWRGDQPVAYVTAAWRLLIVGAPPLRIDWGIRVDARRHDPDGIIRTVGEALAELGV